MLDIIKTLFTYTIALVVIIGGGLLLVIPTDVSHSELLPVLTSIIGAVITFVFQERSYSARQDAQQQTIAALTGTQPPAPPAG